MLNNKNKGFKAYKKYWEDQADFMNKAPWHKDKILKLTISIDFNDNLKELQFSSHSLKKENGEPIIRLKIPYNYNEFRDFEFKSLQLLGIQQNWLTDISLTNSHCSHN